MDEAAAVEPTWGVDDEAAPEDVVPLDGAPLAWAAFDVDGLVLVQPATATAITTNMTATILIYVNFMYTSP
jgi:hypothetical protein